jgi:hypothetical protein
LQFRHQSCVDPQMSQTSSSDPSGLFIDSILNRIGVPGYSPGRFAVAYPTTERGSERRSHGNRRIGTSPGRDDRTVAAILSIHDPKVSFGPRRTDLSANSSLIRPSQLIRLIRVRVVRPATRGFPASRTDSAVSIRSPLRSAFRRSGRHSSGSLRATDLDHIIERSATTIIHRGSRPCRTA